MADLNLDYDINKAFARIEDELIASMVRNLANHKVEEINSGMEWSQWQALQLKALMDYQTKNRRKYAREFAKINAKITELLRRSYAKGNADEERRILQAIKKGFKVRGRNQGASAGMAAGEFFKVNDRKLEALITAVHHDMSSAEVAILRRADDIYRKVIFDAQAYVNTGSATYEKAVDMATKDMRTAGLQCVTYKDGSQHTLEDYADMALKTGTKRAYLGGEGSQRQGWGIYTVIVNRRSDRGPNGVCSDCVRFVGKVYIDDVWGDGPKDGISPVTGRKYPLLSTAIADGLYHPRCRDSHTTYFEGISTMGDPYSREELQEAVEAQDKEKRAKDVERYISSWERREKYALSDEEKDICRKKIDYWKSQRP